MWLTKLFALILPARIKRAYVLSGLYAILTKQEYINAEVLASLNQSLQLVSNPASLETPTRSACWLNMGLCETASLDSPNALIEEIITKTPPYWRYGIDNDFRHDLQRLVKYIRPNTFFAQAVPQQNVVPHSASWHRV